MEKHIIEVLQTGITIVTGLGLTRINNILAILKRRENINAVYVKLGRGKEIIKKV